MKGAKACTVMPTVFLQVIAVQSLKLTAGLPALRRAGHSHTASLHGKLGCMRHVSLQAVTCLLELAVCVQRSVIVPPEQGYGKQGLLEIPPDATFELQVQVLSVK